MQAKRIFQLLTACIWAVLALLAIETCERARLWMAERNYAHYFNEQNARVYGMAPAHDVAETLEGWRQAAPDAERDDVETGAHAARNRIPSGLRSDSQRAAFSALSEDHRHIILTLEGRLILRLTRDGKLIDSFGNPALEKGMFVLQDKPSPDENAWYKILQAAQNAVEPVAFEVEHYQGPKAFHTVAVTPVHDSEDGAREVLVVADDITQEKSLLERTDGAPPPEESRWEISGYSLKKNWSGPDTFLTSNNVGFRDHDVVLPKPEGVFRILCVGASTTEEGGSVDATYPKMVERNLRAWFDTERIEVLNCGILGMNSYVIRQRIYDYLALSPDLVLYYGPVNDITHMYFRIWLEYTQAARSPLRWSKALSRMFNRRFLPSDEMLTEFLNATTYRNLRALNYAVRESDAEMGIISFAYPRLAPWQINAKNYYDVNLREVWGSQGILNFDAYCHVIDLHNRLIKKICERDAMFYIPLAEEFDGGMDCFFDICHMTTQGMEVKANIIGRHVARYLKYRGYFSSPDSTSRNDE